MAIANYTRKINGMRSIPQSLQIRSSKNYLKTTPERYMTPPDIFDLVLILRALMHHLSGIFGLWIGWGMTKNHLRIVSRERSLKCMLCSKCNGRLLLTFSGQKGSRFSGPYGIAGQSIIRHFFVAKKIKKPAIWAHKNLIKKGPLWHVWGHYMGRSCA